MKSKKELSAEILNRIKTITKSAIDHENYEKALAAIAFMGEYLYQYNQYYTEDKLESFLTIISEKLKHKWNKGKEYEASDNILLYDGFGLDTRGVILMYLNALGLNGYKVTYVTNRKMHNNITTIKSMCYKYGIDISFINFDNYIEWAKGLSEEFERVKPKAAFFYTTPFDVSGIVAFHMYEGLVDRYLIDLTDHAFWLGKSAFHQRLWSALQHRCGQTFNLCVVLLHH